MNWWPLFSRRRRERELDEEIQAHLAMAKRDRTERGESPQSAELAARRELGNRTLVQEVTREMWGWISLERLWQDVRYALRMMRRSPGFTAVAVLSLALGIGANTAIFSMIQTVMLRLLPVQEPERLVEVLNKFPGQDRWSAFSWPGYVYMRDHTQTFSDMIVDCPNYAGFQVRGQGLERERVDGDYVSGNFFSTLGVKAVMGRLIGPEDDHMGSGSPVAVVSWSYWNSRFNGDLGILGKRIDVDDVPVTVIGVTPREFFGLQVGSKQNIWLPLGMEPIVRKGNSYISSASWKWLTLVGRLKRGVSIEQARAEMAVLYRRTIEEEAKTNDDPSIRLWTVELAPAGAGLTHLRDRFGKPLLFLMATVGLLLLIACMNVASMLLARGAARDREMALRVSLGAGRVRLVRQMLTESLMLSTSGGLIGIALAYFGTSALVKVIASGQDRFELQVLQVRPDLVVLLFTAGVSLLTGVLFGLVPAWRAQGASPAASLRAAGGIRETGLRRLFGKSLVVIQVALSILLLSAAGLFVGHLSNLEHLDLGFHRDHLLLMQIDPHISYSRERLSSEYRELMDRMEAIPGVRSATICRISPLEGVGANRAATVEGYQDKPGERRVLWENWIAPKYFETLGTPLLAGRDFKFQETGRVAIVNQTMARKYFADGNPVGRHVTFDGDANPYEIVGLVGDSKYGGMRETALPTIYFNTFQQGPAGQFAIRTSINPAAVEPALRRVVRESFSAVEVQRIQTMEEQVDATIIPERLMAMLSGLFGALGLMLAAIGLYGLLAYTVARRIHEIGIRMALGATRNDVIRMVLGDALGMVCAGLVIGVPVVFWSRRFAASLIEGMPAESLVPIAFGAVAMFAVALLAAFIPARFASRVDPMVALRNE
jgi:putative ABC transport system permease protein